MVRRFNADLANDFGNLVNRTVTMASRYLDGSRPPARPATAAPLATEWATTLPTAAGDLEACLLHDALAGLWGFVGAANRFVEAEAPWSLAKAARNGDASAEARLRDVLGDLVEACRLVALAAAPFMPSIAPRVLEQLGYGYPYRADGNAGPPILQELQWGHHAADAGVLGTPTPLFPRLESEVASTAAG
jgi:methionyl-tRNA synthetase